MAEVLAGNLTGSGDLNGDLVIGYEEPGSYNKGYMSGWNNGINRGIEICENDYKPMVEQFIPPEDKCILIFPDHNMMYLDNVTCQNIRDKQLQPNNKR